MTTINLMVPMPFELLGQTAAARDICATFTDYNVTEDECYQFGDIMDFLWSNVDLLTKKRGHQPQPNILLRTGVAQVAERWLEARRQKITVTPPQTIVDPAVSQILSQETSWSDNAMKNHQWAMAAENVIGTLLEMYIASEMEHYGWVWCAGDFIRAVDFLKKTDDGFITLQVKNRSTSENSSSAAIRAGTDIKKWHRLNAYTGKTYWDTFPAPELQDVLSEEGFLDFIGENI